MKLTQEQLRELIKEEYLRGIPEFTLRQATTKYVEDIRKQLFRYIMMNKSLTGQSQREALSAANEVLEDLEEKANDLLEEQLFEFTRKI
jgi:hypothetical protein